MPLPVVAGLWDRVQEKIGLKSAVMPGYTCSLASLIQPQKVNLGAMRDRSMSHLSLPICKWPRYGEETSER